jgi:EAL domain-containing protein (putative c-di-GMP-specific phosphodiesterase class I)
MVSPAEFIPLAERHNLMAQVDLWVVTNTLKALRESAIIEYAPHTLCSINLSGQSLSGDNFLENITRSINNGGVNPACICFEVTETAAIHDLTKARYFITSLRELGCKFALDDFGAGLSSFTYLRTLPLDFVKIDGFFVKDILTDPVAETMVKSIHEVGTAMGLETVAEYVETIEIGDRLTALGIHYGQGFGIGKPMALSEYIARQLAHTSSAHG